MIVDGVSIPLAYSVDLSRLSYNVFQTHEPRRGLAERSGAVGLMLAEVKPVPCS